MDEMLQTPLKTAIPLTETTPVFDTHNNLLREPSNHPLEDDAPPGNALKTATPDRLKLPGAFKYPERYNSPTDLMMSPISRVLHARSRKPRAIPSTHNLQEMGIFAS